MPIRLRLDALLTNSGMADAARERFEAAFRENSVAKPTPELILVPEVDLGCPGFDDWFAPIRSWLRPDSSVVGFPVAQESWSDPLVRRILSAGAISVFTLGLVSGTSLQRALLRVQEVKRGPSPPHYDLSALVLHARPAEQRRWEALRNSFGRKLYCAWCMLMPDDLPFDDELRVLNNIPERDLSDDGARFLEHRKRLCAGIESFDYSSVFWAGKVDDQITPQSYFGDSLSAHAILAAVSVAIQRARSDAAIRPPDRWAFEVSAIVRSYYDPLILVSMLRWFRRDELWWGDDAEQQKSCALEVLRRSQQPDIEMLVCELLLAAAEAKLPAPARLVIQQEALTQRRRQASAPLEVALAALKHANPSTEATR